MSKFGYFPKSEEDFLNYLHELENKPHDYNSIAEALTDATVAFFNYFASKHGMTGFQASWSALQFLAKTRGMEAPFMIVDSEKLLYPQYDLVKDVEEFLEKSKKEVGKIAKKMMEEEEKPYHPEVRARWEALMQYCDEE